MALMFKETKAHVQNYSRFKEDYGPGAEEKEDRNDKLSRPEDFVAIFKGDSNEDFKLGLKVTKNSLKVNMHNVGYISFLVQVPLDLHKGCVLEERA